MRSGIEISDDFKKHIEQMQESDDLISAHIGITIVSPPSPDRTFHKGRIDALAQKLRHDGYAVLKTDYSRITIAATPAELLKIAEYEEVASITEAKDILLDAVLLRRNLAL